MLHYHEKVSMISLGFFFEEKKIKKRKRKSYCCYMYRWKHLSSSRQWSMELFWTLPFLVKADIRKRKNITSTLYEP